MFYLFAGRRPNQAMQLTAGKPAVYAWSVCRRVRPQREVRRVRSLLRRVFLGRCSPRQEFITVLTSFRHQRPNQAMQLTASKPAVYAQSVCRRSGMLRFMHRGLAAADLVAR